MSTRKVAVADLKPGMILAPEANEALRSPFNTRLRLTPENIADLARESVTAVGVAGTLAAFEQTIMAIGGVSEADVTLDEPGFSLDMSAFVVGREIPVDIYIEDEPGKIHKLIRAGVAFTHEMDEVIGGAAIDRVVVPESQRHRFDLYQRIVKDARQAARDEGFDGKFLDKTRVQDYYRFMDAYMAITPQALRPGVKAPVALFASVGEDRRVVPVAEAGAVVDGDRLGRWIEGDVNLLIAKVDRPAYERYLQEMQTKTKEPTIRAALVRENAKMIITGLAENPRSEKLMGQTAAAVTDLTVSVLENPTTFYGLMKINNYDYYTYTHSVNVSTLTLALAMEMGVTDQTDLGELGLGAMLHDLGKAQVKSELINKPGKLTDEEFAKVRGHVMLGFEMLKGNPAIPKRAFYPLLQHHEKLSGTGYPNKLPADKIHLFGRIAAVIDIYDALTTERSYKKAFTPFDALSLINRNEADFDQNVFAKLVQLIHRQQIVE